MTAQRPREAEPPETTAQARGLSTERAFPPGTPAVVAGLMLSMFLVALDATIVSTAMPTIVGNLGGFTLYAWVPAVYLLTSAVTTPIYGKVSDLYGRKPVLFVGIGLFLLGSFTCGAAPSMLLLIIFRAIQGLGAGAVLPITITIIGDIFTLEQRARIQGVFSSVWGISSVIGPLLGGVLVDSVGWRWIFYLNLPVGVLAVIMIAMFFRERPAPARHKLDVAGATFLTVGLTSILLVLIEGGQAWPWLSAQSFGLILLTVMSVALFLWQEHRAPEPAVPLDLFRSRIVAVSAIGTFFAGVVLISVSFEIPLYAQGVLGQDALHAGFTLAPMSIGWPLAGAFSGRLALRFGYRATAAAGALLILVGTALLLFLRIDSEIGLAMVLCFLIGAGLGLCSTAMMVAVQSAVLWNRRGVATATNMFVRSFGSVAGLAVMGAIINHATGPTGGSAATNQALDVHARHGVPPALLQHIHTALYHGIHQAFVAALIPAALTFIAVLGLPGGSAREHEARERAPEPEMGPRSAAGE